MARILACGGERLKVVRGQKYTVHLRTAFPAIEGLIRMRLVAEGFEVLKFAGEIVELKATRTRVVWLPDSVLTVTGD